MSSNVFVAVTDDEEIAPDVCTLEQMLLAS
jgi:hypothetical protein